MFRGKVNISDLVLWHGIKGLFISPRISFAPTLRLTTIIEHFVMNAISTVQHTQTSEEVMNWRINYLNDIGKTLLNSHVPWISVEKPTGLFALPINYFERFNDEGNERLKELSPDALFAIFALLATRVEHYIRHEDTLRRMTIQLRWIILARSKQALSDKAQAVMDECGFSSEQQDFIWRWIKREFNVFEVTRSEDSEIQMNLLDEPDSQVAF